MKVFKKSDINKINTTHIDECGLHYLDRANNIVSLSEIKVYDITYDKNGFPQFLIYENYQWKRVSAKHFTPFQTRGIVEKEAFKNAIK